MYAAMGIAVLVKGPIGVLLPGAVVGLYLLVRGSAQPAADAQISNDRILAILRRFNPARILRTIWSMRPLTALAMVLLVAGPWFAAVGWRTGGTFIYEFFGVQNFGRFVGAMDNHGGGIWYYLPAILVGFFPWSIFAIPTVLDLIRRWRGREPGQNGAKFLTCWILVYLGFFSIAATKLPNYVLPAYPALALATACFVDRWLGQPARVSRWWPRLSFGTLLAVGAAAAIVPTIVFNGSHTSQAIVERLGIAPELTDDLMLIGWLGLILLAAGGIGLILAELGKPQPAVAALAFLTIGFCVALFAGVAVRIDRHQPCPAVAEAIHQHSSGTPQVVQFGYFRPSLVYYSDTRVENCRNCAARGRFSGKLRRCVRRDDRRTLCPARPTFAGRCDGDRAAAGISAPGHGVGFIPAESCGGASGGAGSLKLISDFVMPRAVVLPAARCPFQCWPIV